MATATLMVLLVSLGSFQATLPAVSKQPSPVFPDTAPGATEFVRWAKATIPEPKFNEPPLQICVVGAVPFAGTAGPQIVEPLWKSRPPLRALEPYAATFHYVEPVAGQPAPKPRTLADAVKICRTPKK